MERGSYDHESAGVGIGRTRRRLRRGAFSALRDISMPGRVIVQWRNSGWEAIHNRLIHTLALCVTVFQSACLSPRPLAAVGSGGSLPDTRYAYAEGRLCEAIRRFSRFRHGDSGGVDRAVGPYDGYEGEGIGVEFSESHYAGYAPDAPGRGLGYESGDLEVEHVWVLEVNRVSAARNT